jgi:hypothetical protein
LRCQFIRAQCKSFEVIGLRLCSEVAEINQSAGFAKRREIARIGATCEAMSGRDRERIAA